MLGLHYLLVPRPLNHAWQYIGRPALQAAPASQPSFSYIVGRMWLRRLPALKKIPRFQYTRAG